jgi:hypothetical protein
MNFMAYLSTNSACNRSFPTTVKWNSPSLTETGHSLDAAKWNKKFALVTARVSVSSNPLLVPWPIAMPPTAHAVATKAQRSTVVRNEETGMKRFRIKIRRIPG